MYRLGVVFVEMSRRSNDWSVIGIMAINLTLDVSMNTTPSLVGTKYIIIILGVGIYMYNIHETQSFFKPLFQISFLHRTFTHVLIQNTADSTFMFK